VLLLISICLLMAPSLYHQILFDGESRVAAIRAATWLPGASLLPFTLGLGAAAFVAFERMFGPTAGTLFSLAFILTGLALLYGVGFALPSAAWFPAHRDVDKVVSRASPDAGFFRIGSALVVTASLPFAIGISADVAVVFFKATQRSGISGSADVGSLCMLLEPGWFTLPGAVRPQAPRLNGPLVGELKAPLGPTAVHLCIDAAAVRAGRTLARALDGTRFAECHPSSRASAFSYRVHAVHSAALPR